MIAHRFCYARAFDRKRQYRRAPFILSLFMSADTQATTVRFSRSDYRTLGLAALGGALEIYDFIIFV